MKLLFSLLVSFTMLSSCATFISPGVSLKATLEGVTVEVLSKGRVDKWFLTGMDTWNIKIVNNSREKIYIAPSNVSFIVGDKTFRPLPYSDPLPGGRAYESAYREQIVLHSNPLPETILLPGYSIGGNIFFFTTAGSLLQKNRKAEFRVVLPIMPLKQSSYLVTLDITLP